MNFNEIMALIKTVFALVFAGFSTIYGAITGCDILIYVGIGIFVSQGLLEGLQATMNKALNGKLDGKLKAYEQALKELKKNGV